jgi:LacI family transcriptional regulator
MSAKRKSAATLSDIGRAVGISAMTVSRALNGHPDVNEETRRKVLTHAERLRYRPNRWARTLVTKRSQIIGIVVPDISHSFFSEITRAVQDTIEEHGYNLMLCHTYGNAKRELAAVEMMLGSHVDGLIVASERLQNDPGIFAELQLDGIPFVLLDRYFPALECRRVRTDDFEVGKIATQHLIDLGHRKIAHIRGPNVSVGDLRYRGYLHALQENGLFVESKWIVENQTGFAGGESAMQELLLLAERPTAVFAVNDPVAMGAVQACRKAKLDVPAELSVIGAGSIEGSSYPNPFLSTVEWSRRELGERAAHTLLDLMAHGALSASIQDSVVPPRLLVRQSTAHVVKHAAVIAAHG